MGKKVTTFAIDNENNVTAYPSRKEAEGGAGDASLFTSPSQLDAVLTGCTGARLIEIWNGIPGVEPVTKFTSRTVAIGRIWKAIQVLAPEAAEETPDAAQQAPAAAPKAAKAARKATAPKEPRAKAEAEPKGDSKKAQVIAMIQKPGGATLAAIMAATDWQAHTVRGFMATVPKKLGLEIVSEKVEGERTYSAKATAAGA